MAACGLGHPFVLGRRVELGQRGLALGFGKLARLQRDSKHFDFGLRIDPAGGARARRGLGRGREGAQNEGEGKVSEHQE